MIAALIIHDLLVDQFLPLLDGVLSLVNAVIVGPWYRLQFKKTKISDFRTRLKSVVRPKLSRLTKESMLHLTALFNWGSRPQTFACLHFHTHRIDLALVVPHVDVAM